MNVCLVLTMYLLFINPVKLIDMKLFLLRYADRSLKYIECLGFADVIIALDQNNLYDGLISIEVVPADSIL